MTLPPRRRYAPAVATLFRDERLIVFDTETVPDLYAAAHLLGLDLNTPAVEVRRAIGRLYARDGEAPESCFLKPVMHRIVALSAIELVRRTRHDPWSIERSCGLHLGEMDEAAQLDMFDRWLAPAPRLVGFNIGGFDLPLLRMRALALGLPMPNLSGQAGRDYWHRFGRDRLDLCDLLSNYGAMTRPSLAEVASLFGVHAKAGTSGADVERMTAVRRYTAISAYCTRDTIVTAHLLLRWSLTTGELSCPAYQASHDALASHSRTLRLDGPPISADPAWVCP